MSEGAVGGGEGGGGQLADVQRQLAALESRYAALVSKHDDTENDLAFQKKRVESAVNKITAEKDEEIAQLKQAFAEVSEKRKAAFTQMKERLEQAGAVVQSYAASKGELEASLASTRAQLDSVQRQLAEREAELGSLRAQSGEAVQSASSRTVELEAAVAALRSESAASAATVAELQSELAAARSKAEALEERVKGKPPAKCSIAIEDGGKETEPPLFPGALENGRSVKFSWGLQGNVRIQWLRSFRGSAWDVIPGKMATRPQYTVSADDIGACLRAEATSTTSGAMVYAETGPVHPSHAMLNALQEPLRKLDATFTVESGGAAPGGSEADRKRGILLNKEKIKLQDAKGKTVAKKEWGDHVKVLLDGDSERRFSVQIESNGPVVPYAAGNQRMRDLIVVAMRTFVHVITKHGGRLNKDLDHLLALALHVRTLNEQAANRPMSTVAAQRRQPSISGGPGGKAPLPPGAKGAAGGASITTPSKRPSDAGAAQGSAPSTPVSNTAGISGQQPASHDRRQSGAADDEWGGFNLPPTAAAPQTTAQVGQLAPAAAAASNGVVRRNAEGQEVDEQGFIVTKNRGFDDIAPKGADDSDDEGAGDDASRGPAIKVQINEQGRAPASAEALKSMTSGLTLGGPKGKKGKKGAAKAGKKGKAGEESGVSIGSISSIGSIGSLNGGSLDGLGLSTAGITISPPASTNNSLIMDNSVPGLPPLTAAPATTDPTDPFADFFKS